MKTKLLIVALVALAALSGCKKDPTAAFNASNSNPKVFETVDFVSNSEDYETLKWFFGDGSTGTGPNVSYSYQYPGTYTVKLEAINGNKSDMFESKIEVTSYSKLKINSIEVLQFPSVNSNGSGWDFTDGPDIFTTISSATTVFYSTSYVSNVNSTPLAFSVFPSYVITDLTADWFIDLIDYDNPDADDYMGYVKFDFTEYFSGVNPFPSSIVKTQNGITVKLLVTWE